MPAEEDIIQRVVLEGDRVIIKQFENIAKSGDQAFKTIQKSADAVSKSTAFSSIGTAITSLQNGFRTLTGAVTPVISSLSALGTQAATTAKRLGLTGAAVVGLSTQLPRLLGHLTQTSDDVVKNAEALGVSTDEFQQLAFAAEQAGIGEDRFRAGMVKMISALEQAGQAEEEFRKNSAKLRNDFIAGEITFFDMQKRLNDLRLTLQQAQNPFKDLGVEIKKDAGGNILLKETFFALSDALQANDNQLQKVAKGREIFGRGGERFVTFANQGSEALRRQMVVAKQYGAVIDENIAKRNEKLNDALAALNRTWRVTEQTILGVFSPTIIKLVNAFTQAEAGWRANTILTATAIANKLVPAVDDLVLLIQGKEADIAKDSIILRIKNAVVDTAAAIKSAFTGVILPAFNALIAGLDTVAKAFNAFFGTELTGGALLAVAVILKLVGGFGLLVTAIQVVIAAVGLLVTTFGAPVVIVIGLVVAALLLLSKALAAVNWKAFGDAAILIWTTIVAALQAAGTQIVALWTALLLQITTLAQGAVVLLQSIWQGFVDWLATIWANLVAAATAVWIAVSNAAQISADFISSIFAGLRDRIIGYWTAVRDFIISVWQSVKGAIEQMTRGAGGQSAPAQGFARGGKITGPGSSTSDNIPILASPGEFMVRAAAVRHYGTAFMHALNGMRLDGFNLGGLIEDNFSMPTLRPALRFADGGLVPQKGNTLNLTIGDQKFEGLAVADETMEDLTRFATGRAIRSAGRKPLWKT